MTWLMLRARYPHPRISNPVNSAIPLVVASFRKSLHVFSVSSPFEEVVGASPSMAYVGDASPSYADQDIDLFSSDMEPSLIGVEIDKLQCWSSQR
ncbi:hypothetical protein BDN72DRAFT_906902 [Pluteus cervinus]|uniref:Uncharacterized protein n=1 Tax=Pluteus cervinus TaxID=181527 RepID=A0ACD2ZXK6_9AGAR|nr:hypothetical protein BDN72DRAFT_906902 [Pluteus cervinus]